MDNCFECHPELVEHIYELANEGSFLCYDDEPHYLCNLHAEEWREMGIFLTLDSDGLITDVGINL